MEKTNTMTTRRLQPRATEATIQAPNVTMTQLAVEAFRRLAIEAQ